MDKLIPINYENQRIMTTQLIAESYETTTDTITKNYNRNKERYEEGKHYFLLQGEELKEFRANGQIDLLQNVNKLYLWTEKGALLHAKSLNTDKAWEVYDQLVETYFRIKENVQTLNTSQLSPELQMFSQMFKAIANNELEQKKIKEDIETTKDELQGIREAVLLNPSSWRKDTSSIIGKVALKLGGFEHIKDVRDGVYKALNETYGVNIKQRLTNKQKNMALEGCSKSKINKVNYLDVIEGDKKLLNGYLSIISKLAIKHGIGGNAN